MSSMSPVRYATAGIAAVVIAVGAYAIGSTSSDGGSSSATNAAGTGLPVQTGQNGQAPSGPVPQSGQAPPGFGSPASGAAASKARAAALAKYKGTVERVMKLDDGSYEVHVIASNGEYHVAVSKDFKVTGAQQGGPGAGGSPGTGAPGTAPQGSTQ
jgi:hypothetical protein